MYRGQLSQGLRDTNESDVKTVHLSPVTCVSLYLRYQTRKSITQTGFVRNLGYFLQILICQTRYPCFGVS